MAFKPLPALVILGVAGAFIVEGNQGNLGPIQGAFNSIFKGKGSGIPIQGLNPNPQPVNGCNTDFILTGDNVRYVARSGPGYIVVIKGQIVYQGNDPSDAGKTVAEQKYNALVCGGQPQ